MLVRMGISWRGRGSRERINEKTLVKPQGGFEIEALR